MKPAAAGAREAGLREAAAPFADAISGHEKDREAEGYPAAERPDSDEPHGEGVGDWLTYGHWRRLRTLAAPPALAGGLLELIEHAEAAGRLHRMRAVESHLIEERERHLELAEVAEGWGRRLCAAIGLPPREGA